MAMICTLIGCSSPELILTSAPEETFPPEGGTVVIQFTSPGIWSLTGVSADSWIDFDMISGEAGEVLVTAVAEANYSDAVRSACVEITSEAIGETIKFSQDPIKVSRYSLADKIAEVDASGMCICVMGEEGVDYEITVNDSWIRPLHTDGNDFYFEIDANDGGERTGMILFCSNMMCMSFKITQKL